MPVTGTLSFSYNGLKTCQPDRLIMYGVNPFPHNDTFWHPWETSLLKILWEKEKLLVMSKFSFNHSVFYSI